MEIDALFFSDQATVIGATRSHPEVMHIVKYGLFCLKKLLSRVELGKPALLPQDLW